MAEVDQVNHPCHYTTGGVECIEAIKASMTTIEFAGYLKGNCMKYLWRYQNKGGLESLRKCEWYLQRLITELAAAAESAGKQPANEAPKVGTSDEA